MFSRKLFSVTTGFTLVEVMIVIAILGIVVAIAIPALMRSRLNANESATKSNLKTFATSIEAYRAAQATPSYPADISGLTAASPAYLDSTWGAGTTATKSGYLFTYARTDASQYAIFAQPAQAAITGNNSFCVDETGVAWSSATSSGAFTSSPCSGGTGAVILQ